MKAKIVYIIHAFNKPDQVQRLIDTLNTENAFFIINIDLKSDLSNFPKEVPDKVQYVTQRHYISWGGISQIEQTIESLKYLKHLGISDYSHVVFLSEYCYPIKSIKKIEDYLTHNQDKSFVLAYKIDETSNYRTPIYQLNHRYITDLIKYNRNKFWHRWLLRFYNKFLVKFMIIKNIQPDGKFVNFHNYQLYAGSNWMMLNEKAVNYILDFLARYGQEYLKLFRYSHCPDESFFHTILMNSPLSDTIATNHHRYIDWSDKNEWPRYLRKADLPAIIKKSKRNALFARKFDTAYCIDILDLIDEQLLKEE